MKKNFFILFLVVLVLFPAKVHAESVDALSQYSFWTQDDISIKSNQRGAETEILVSTKNVETEYGYLVIKGVMEDLVAEKSNLKGLEVSYELDSTATFFLSVFLEDINNTQIELAKEAVFARERNGDIYAYSFVDGQYEVRENGSGKVMLPFSSFEDKADFSWEELSAYGICLVIPKNTELVLTLGAVKETPIASIPYFRGADKIELPVQGESIGEYEVSDNGFVIKIKNENSGVSYENGILSVNKEAEEGTVILEAKNKEGIIATKEIKLTNALRNTTDFLPKFPAPDEIQPIVIPMKTMLGQSIFCWIRLIVCAVVLVIVIMYLICYRKAMREMKGEI